MRRRELLAAMSAGAAPWAAQRQAVAAENDPGLPAIEAGYFGMHFHRLVGKPGDRQAPTAWPGQVNIGTIRLWDADTRWADIAPRPGVWNFARLDAYVSQAVAHGATVLYTLGSTPRWASARPDEPGPYGPGCAAEPVRLGHWTEYVQRVVTRYRGVIAAYELWNEPNFTDFARDRGGHGFFTGSVSAMLDMARTARQVIGEIDPSARLATPGFVNGPDRLELFLREGGAALVDAVAYHFYSDGVPRFMAQLGEVREVMRRCDVAGLPLWNTECGVETLSAPDAATAAGRGLPGEAGAAASMAQLLLMGAACGLQRFDYYAWDNGRTGMIDAQSQPRPRLAAYAQVQSWLLGARLGAPERLPAGVVRIAGQRGTSRFVLAWADTPTDHWLPVPRGWRLTDLQRLLAPSPLPVPPRVADGAALKLSPWPLFIQWDLSTPSSS